MSSADAAHISGGIEPSIDGHRSNIDRVHHHKRYPRYTSSGLLMRRNGLKWPWHRYQCATVFLWSFDIAWFAAFQLQMLEPLAVEIVLSILFYISALTMAIMGLIAMYIDPADSCIFDENIAETSPNGGSLYCSVPGLSIAEYAINAFVISTIIASG
ncbi:hypothetical protein Pmar_PMAR012056 [Perkinsus marinus ATCC 50983]|uniref:Uncharacterized protein n=1 Tax=Perkinsus marinus (strain ATCC 50983 / TXsc) TaxID=423536 RepID=C5LSC1_PERM5|nr:hypothetical protein Pmar_PMAR012056 [Perkinsus marinus ATCC 50983]EER00371.1 hypothetical protein Pmar_PMAR012056 [Perkinsus marinus ATCC 50983]|eukprot:XP_002767653.1 hypothetical protein Pmar_PMAR012056 [Perkinsus marinus ATCC 50983]